MMMQIPSDQEFDEMISQAIDTLPKRDIENLQNVVIAYADEPDEYQREKINLRGDTLLLGLYEGIPLTERGAGYNLVLPDKITLFKQPLVYYAQSKGSKLEEEVRHTLWHEIAHFYGLNHDDIHKRETNF
jgi:predicted Zn-dependent protease with MMP-like domain